MTALAKRLVACRHFRWMPGMRGHDRYVFFRVVERFHEGFLVRFRNPPTRQHKEHRFRDDSALNPPIAPDLTDPGTLGCLLGLVREAWKDPLICTANGYPTLRWWVEGARFPEHRTTRKVPGTLYNTEAEALVAALEAAPCP